MITDLIRDMLVRYYLYLISSCQVLLWQCQSLSFACCSLPFKVYHSSFNCSRSPAKTSEFLMAHSNVWPVPGADEANLALFLWDQLCCKGNRKGRERRVGEREQQREVENGLEGGGKMLLLCQGQVEWCVMSSEVDCGVDHWRHCGFMVRPASLSRLKGHQVYWHHLLDHLQNCLLDWICSWPPAEDMHVCTPVHLLWLHGSMCVWGVCGWVSMVWVCMRVWWMVIQLLASTCY